jgi:hypothetical protein
MKIVDLDYIENVNEIEELISKDYDDNCSEWNNWSNWNKWSNWSNKS